MKKKKSDFYKKIISLFLVEMCVGFFFLKVFINKIQQKDLSVQKEKCELNARTYSNQIMNNLNAGMAVTESLEQIIISEDGQCDKFYEVASNLFSDNIESIQIAPEGVVTNIYPEDGNQSGKIDLLHDEARKNYVQYAVDNDMAVLQGPFSLKQGGSGIAIRNPVFLEDNGQKSFWGFTIVIIRVPDIFSESVESLQDFGYTYSLKKTVSPWKSDFVYVYGSPDTPKDPVSASFEFQKDTWKLDVAPVGGWKNTDLLFKSWCSGVLFTILLSLLGVTIYNLHEKKMLLSRLSQTDKLTNIYNRSGYDKQVDTFIKKNKNSTFVVAELDIDNFKFINDMYGHLSGDTALQSLSKCMKNTFSSEVIIGRNGGDEFCLLLPHETCASIKETLEKFVMEPKYFVYKEEIHPFTISLGYAEYPTHATTRQELMRCADGALYQVKLNGKNGLNAFTAGTQEIRSQLGFALKDISENLPGAFLIYKADPCDDTLLFANDEMLRLAGCCSMKEFFEYTDRRFRNLVCQKDRDRVEKSIWQQINAGQGHSNDYVRFSFLRKDGSEVQVLDHGRIVNNSYYGRVFYVLMSNVEQLKDHFPEI